MQERELKEQQMMRDIHYQELLHEREVLTFACVCLHLHWPLLQDLVLLRSHAAVHVVTGRPRLYVPDKG